MDFGLGNLFSVEQACQHAGLVAEITSEPRRIATADIVILPGVGAFGDAMAELQRRDLVAPLHDFVATDRPLVGICLGMQLLMRESEEFGSHAGLGLIDGTVRHFNRDGGNPVKVPQIGWNRITAAERACWNDTLLADLRDGEYLYFVHSYCVAPTDESISLATTVYGTVCYCAALKWHNVFGCQFHPERSGAAGLRMYRNLAGSAGAVSVDR